MMLGFIILLNFYAQWKYDYLTVMVNSYKDDLVVLITQAKHKYT